MRKSESACRILVNLERVRSLVVEFQYYNLCRMKWKNRFEDLENTIQ